DGRIAVARGRSAMGNVGARRAVPSLCESPRLPAVGFTLKVGPRPPGSAEKVDIPAVPREVLRRRRFDDQRHAGEACVTRQADEEVLADATLAEVRVAVAAGAARELGIVDVHAAEGAALEARVEVGEEGRVARVLVDCVAGGEGVAGVEADADALACAARAAEQRQLLPGAPEQRAVAGGVLE